MPGNNGNIGKDKSDVSVYTIITVRKKKKGADCE